MKLILSTSNIVGGGSAYRPISTNKSNLEFTSSLRSNFQHNASADAQPITNGTTAKANGEIKLPQWTRYSPETSTIEVPTLDFNETALEEEREQYDITLKLFFLPGTVSADREQHIREAIQLVLKELHMPSLDLLIASFPGVYFDEEEDCPSKISTRSPVETEPEPLADHVTTWRILEKLLAEGTVKRLGVAEFGHDRLQAFLTEVVSKPSVDQINLRDCCSVPKDLMKLAKSQSIDLLVHNDCSNILPRGTVRELLGPEGAGILPGSPQTGDKRKAHHDDSALGDALSGEIHPQWVVKYTAVVRNRGVVENKGYFAMAEVKE